MYSTEYALKPKSAGNIVSEDLRHASTCDPLLYVMPPLSMAQSQKTRENQYLRQT